MTMEIRTGKTISYTPSNVKIVKDPHHDGVGSWMFFAESYWYKHGLVEKWTKVGKVSLTPERVRALYSILPEVRMKEDAETSDLKEICKNNI